nr:MAG TPA: hypothetical protein [Bacteriophage sp.]DAU17859.1 MAG TPA: hypothetical protein [Bacteriophage sp.]
MYYNNPALSLVLCNNSSVISFPASRAYSSFSF